MKGYSANKNVPEAGEPPEVVWGNAAGLQGTCSLRGNVMVGAAPGSDLRIPDPSVSRRHCLLFTGRGTGARWVADLGSRNGTWLNGRRIRQPSPLRDRDCIRVGRTNFLIVFLEKAGNEKGQIPDTPRVTGEEIS